MHNGSNTRVPRGIINLSDDRNKAVADGAISFFLDHFVGVRVSKHAYGIEVNIPFDPFDAEHVRRVSQSYVSMAGDRRLTGHFNTILAKVITAVEHVQCYNLFGTS